MPAEARAEAPASGRNDKLKLMILKTKSPEPSGMEGVFPVHDGHAIGKQQQETEMPSSGKGTSNRGFASMDEAKQRDIASKGGQSVPPEKRSFSKDPALAAEAGRKGGESVPDEKRSFSKDPELAAEAGRKGGESSQGGRGK